MTGRWLVVGIAAGLAAVYGLGWLVASDPERRTYGWIAAAAALVVYLSTKV